MRKSHVLSLFGLLAGVAIGIVWFALSDPVDEGNELLALPEVNAGESWSPPNTELKRPDSIAPTGEIGRAESRVGEGRQVDATGALADVPEDQLRWIEGRLILPEGAIWDETAVALSVASPDRKRASRALFRMITREESAPTEETEVLYRARFQSDGSFRVACSKDTEWAYLEIDSSIMYLAEPQAVKLEGPVTYADLAPLLGSSVKGQWIAEANASPVELEFTGGVVYLTALRDTNMPAFFDLDGGEGVAAFHRTRVSADGKFELRGVDPNVDWTLVSHPPRLASAVSDSLELVPGEELELEINLVRGAHLSGRVENPSGKPLLGARLVVMNSSDDVAFERTKLATRESLSRGDGSFDLYGVAPGEVRLTAELDGYRKPIRKKLELEPGAEETDILFKMRRGRALRGTVVWPDGTPVAGAVVEVGRDSTEKTGGLDASWRSRYGTAETDEAGQFEVGGLKRRASSIWAWASRKSGGRWVEGMARMDGVKASEDEELRLVLDEKPLLTGFVKDAEGNPVQDFELQVRADDGAGSMMTVWMRKDQESERSFSTEDGSFRIERLDEGDYTVSAIAEGFASSTPLGFRLPIDFSTPPLQIEVLGFGGISGVVVDPRGAAVPGTEISLSMNSTETVDLLLAEVQAPIKVRTNGRGEFTFNQLQPGEISLVAEHESWVSSAKTPFEVFPGELLSGVTIRLREGATLTVEVLDSEGSPVEDYSVRVRGHQRVNTFRGQISNSSRVDSNGWAEFEGQTPGTVTVTAWPATRQPDAADYMDEDFVIEQSYDRGNRRLYAEVELFEGEATHLVLGGVVEGLGDPVAVSGRVTLRGNPLSASVEFEPQHDGVAAKTVRATTDESGRYELELAFPGDYTISVDPLVEDSKTQQSLEGLRQFRRVRPVSSVTFDFAIPAGRISGTVFNPDGEPAKDVPVTIRRVGVPGKESGGRRNWFPGQHQTDENGGYEFEGLEPGSYSVGAGSSMMALFLGGASGYGRTLSDTILLAEDEDRSRVDIELGPACEIKGDVVDKDGKPVNGASIFAFDASGVPVDSLSSTTSNASGRFIYEGISPGVYAFMARTQDLASPLSKLVRVDEKEGDRLTLEIETGTVLNIVLLDLDGNALPIEVSVIDAEGRAMNDLHSFGGAISRMNGIGGTRDSNQVGPVSPGAFEVSVKADGYPEQARNIVVRGNEAEQDVVMRVEE